AADFAVRFSGYGRSRLKAARESKASHWTGDHHRGDDRPRRGSGSELRRRDASWRTKHAELYAAESTGKMRAAGAFEARLEQHGKRVVDVRRVHYGTWKCRGDPLRAWHSHV